MVYIHLFEVFAFNKLMILFTSAFSSTCHSLRLDSQSFSLALTLKYSTCSLLLTSKTSFKCRRFQIELSLTTFPILSCLLLPSWGRVKHLVSLRLWLTTENPTQLTLVTPNALVWHNDTNADPWALTQIYWIRISRGEAKGSAFIQAPWVILLFAEVWERLP